MRLKKASFLFCTDERKRQAPIHAQGLSNESRLSVFTALLFTSIERDLSRLGWA